MSKTPDPKEVAASEKEAAERKAKIAAKKKEIAELEKLETVDLTEKPSKAEDLISASNAAATYSPNNRGPRTVPDVTTQLLVQGDDRAYV